MCLPCRLALVLVDTGARCDLVFVMWLPMSLQLLSRWVKRLPDSPSVRTWLVVLGNLLRTVRGVVTVTASLTGVWLRGFSKAQLWCGFAIIGWCGG